MAIFLSKEYKQFLDYAKSKGYSVGAVATPRNPSLNLPVIHHMTGTCTLELMKEHLEAVNNSGPRIDLPMLPMSLGYA